MPRSPWTAPSPACGARASARRSWDGASSHPTINFDNGTSFRFTDGTPHEILHLAQEAADGQDVRIGGGPSTVRQFLEADLIDFMHLVIVPITLGRGLCLLEGLSGIENRFTIESVTSPSGLIHQLWNKNVQA